MPLYEHVVIARQDITNTQAEGLVEHLVAFSPKTAGHLCPASTGA